MRFYKVVKEILITYSPSIYKGEVVCFSSYFKKLVLLVSGKIRPLTEEELRWLRPHLRNEHKDGDL